MVRATSMREILLYLDHADLSGIADKKARHEAELRDALAYSGALLVISGAHLLDLARADTETRDRWTNAVLGLAPLRIAMEPGIHRPIERHAFVALVAEFGPTLDIVGPVLSKVDDAGKASLEAFKQNPRAKLSKKELAKTVEAVFDDDKLDEMLSALGMDRSKLREFGVDIDQFRALASQFGLTPEQVVHEATVGKDEAVARGDYAAYLQRQRRDDRGRLKHGSDHADEAHLTFALCTDVFTVDGNVEHALSALRDKPLPIPSGRDPGRDNRLRAFQVGNLDKVALALRALADEGDEERTRDA